MRCSTKRSVTMFHSHIVSPVLRKLNNGFLLKREVLEEKVIYQNVFVYTKGLQKHKAKKARRKEDQ